MSADPTRRRVAAVARCSVHPGRRAVDACPACGRGRCGSDAAAYGAGGCAGCVSSTAAAARPGVVELSTRAGLAALAVGYAGGWIAAEYVDTQYFAVLTPGLVGLGCAWAAAAAATTLRRFLTLAVAAVIALVATGLSDRLVPGGQNLFVPVGHRLPPYAAAVVGVVLWPVLFGPPRRTPTRRPRP